MPTPLLKAGIAKSFIIEVYKKTLGVVGLGNRSHVATVAKAMGMKLLANDDLLQNEHPMKCGWKWIYY